MSGWCDSLFKLSPRGTKSTRSANGGSAQRIHGIHHHGTHGVGHIGRAQLNHSPVLGDFVGYVGVDVKLGHDIASVPRVNDAYRIREAEWGLGNTGSGVHVKSTRNITKVHCTMELVFYCDGANRWTRGDGNRFWDKEIYPCIDLGTWYRWIAARPNVFGDEFSPFHEFSLILGAHHIIGPRVETAKCVEGTGGMRIQGSDFGHGVVCIYHIMCLFQF
jgi:hypothetical protein